MKRQIVTFCAVFLVATTLSYASGAKDYTKVKDGTKDSHLVSNLSYPVFNIPVLDNAISNEIVTHYEDFALTAETEWEDYTKAVQEVDSEATAPQFTYQVSYEKPIITDKYISVLFTRYIFSGGAHGETQLITFTYDKENDKLLSITEAAGKSLEEIAGICKLTLKNEIQYEASSSVDRNSMIDAGTIALPKNFADFTFDGKVVTVYFEQYQVAPYAAGIQKVEIPIVK